MTQPATPPSPNHQTAPAHHHPAQHHPAQQPRRAGVGWIVALVVAGVAGVLVIGVVAMLGTMSIGTQHEGDEEFDEFYCQTFPEDC